MENRRKNRGLCLSVVGLNQEIPPKLSQNLVSRRKKSEKFVSHSQGKNHKFRHSVVGKKTTKFVNRSRARMAKLFCRNWKKDGDLFNIYCKIKTRNLIIYEGKNHKFRHLVAGKHHDFVIFAKKIARIIRNNRQQKHISKFVNRSCENQSRNSSVGFREKYLKILQSIVIYREVTFSPTDGFSHFLIFENQQFLSNGETTIFFNCSRKKRRFSSKNCEIKPQFSTDDLEIRPRFSPNDL